MQFARIRRVPVFAVGVNQWEADGVDVAGVCVYPHVDGRGDTNGCAFCSTVYRATPLYISFAANLQGGLLLPIFLMKTMGVRELK